MLGLVRKAVKAVVETFPVAALCRLLAPDRVRQVVLCFDLEPDERAGRTGAPRPWTGFERLVPRIAPLRAELVGATGAPAAFTWDLRMDPQVAEIWGSPAWVAEAHRRAFSGMEEAGDEMALHTHYWRPAAGGWRMDPDPAWDEHCLTTSLDAFESRFGRPCAVHRSGDWHLNGELLATLGARGVRVDLTVEPGIAADMPLAEGEDHSPPDYGDVPVAPYRSSPEAFPLPDRPSPSGPLLIPLLRGPRRKGAWGGTLYLGMHPAIFAVRLVGELLRSRPSVLAFAVRADPDLIGAWDAVVANLLHLARHSGTRFVTAREAAAL